MLFPCVVYCEGRAAANWKQSRRPFPLRKMNRLSVPLPGPADDDALPCKRSCLAKWRAGDPRAC
jgi:hypothetical protein